MKRTKSVLMDCLRKNKSALILFAVTTALNGAVFFLYDLAAEPFIYAEVAATVFLFVLLSIDFFREKKAAEQRQRQKNRLLLGDTEERDDTLRDEDYGEMLEHLTREIGRLQTDFAAKRQADNDYYTAWVHQIKTPIAVMKLHLAEETETNKAMSAELFRIEQYVEMVLDYIRLESLSNDLLIQPYSLDELIRETLRKFAPQFVLRKLKLTYEPTEQTVVTDKKWLTFILEQLISNAIKYTPAGEIAVKVKDCTIKIADTGIGIAPEDVPRIFEKGYTGVNGRLGQQSSGLGLFLTKKAADLLSATVTVQSTAGKGSAFTIKLPTPRS